MWSCAGTCLAGCRSRSRIPSSCPLTITERRATRLSEFGVDARVRTHDRDDRDGQLAARQRSDHPDVFLPVKMEEALDLEDGLCRWQLLCKAPFPNTRDSRIAHRLEEGRWGWHYRTTLRTIIRACGRVVRSPDDHGATYLADDSLLDVFDRARGDMPDRFATQVDRMERPPLPAFSPSEALGEVSGHGPGRSRSGGDRRHPLSDVWE